MRLIDAGELKYYIDVYNVACGCNDDHQKEILDAIDYQEPVKLVMCKDCKHRPIKKDNGTIVPPGDDEKCPCLCDDEFYSWIPRDDFFCANGERREE